MLDNFTLRSLPSGPVSWGLDYYSWCATGPYHCWHPCCNNHDYFRRQTTGAKSAANQLAVSPEGDAPMHINKLIGDLKTYFQINGVLIIIGLVLLVLILIAFIVAIIAMGANPEFNFEFGA